MLAGALSLGLTMGDLRDMQVNALGWVIHASNSLQPTGAERKEREEVIEGNVALMKQFVT